MEKLKNKIFIVLFFTNSFFVYSQEIYKSNIILLVDNVIITDNITMEFVNEKNEVQSNFNYSLGKEMIVSSELFGKQDLFIKFNYFGELNGLPKEYKYSFRFIKGWIYKTNYLIIRLYNLDKKEFRKSFCNEKDDYVIDIQNQNYSKNTVLCKKMKVRL